MDFEEYAQHMTQKYQVALAIAVIRNKPDNISSEQFIAQLKGKIESRDQGNNNSSVPLTGDFNFEDNDFNIDDNDDSLTIDEFHKRSDAEEIINQSADSTNLLRNEEINKKPHQGAPENYCIDSRQHFNNTTEEEISNIDRALNNNKVTTLSDASKDETNSLGDILRTLKDIDNNDKECYQRTDFNSTQYSTPMLISPSLINFSEEIVEENMMICNNPHNNNKDFIHLVDKSNTQITIDERVKATVVKNFNKNTKLNKPDDMIINENVNDHSEDNVAFKNTYEMEVEMALNDILEPEPNGQFNDTNINFIQEKTTIVSKNIAKELNKQTYAVNQEKNDNMINNKHNSIGDININQNIAPTNLIENSTQDTILYTLHGFTQNTSYSQSQYQNIEIPEAFIYGNKNKEIVKKDHNTQKNIQVFDKDIGNANLDNEVFEKDKHISQDSNTLIVDSSQIQYIIDQSGHTYAILNSMQLGKEPFREEHFNKNKSSEIINKSIPQRKVKEQSIEADTQATRTKRTENKEANSQTNTEMFDIDEYLDKDMAECEEVVPFKVVKELSKIKAFLSKRERRGSTDGSSDSGYKTDSQNSFKSVSARLSDDWVHESANCLYTYIIQCALVTVTQEIVNEMAQVLGRLIDRLHEEEKYPLFLEELLEKVDSLVRELSQDSGSYENVLLDKDETIQRLLLLNKSSHILKFSIEKIATNLEKVHSSLVSKENLYELTNISEVENLRYTFYILEIFIQMYVKVKDSCQSTQSSQETKMLKKSSITEIWRKKWNPDLKETKNVGSQDKSCVLSKCGEVLNKIIVDCMEGYGLVSFAALQCFNLLQS